MLKVENISFSYTSEEVLHQISFKVSKGKYLAVVGESGCGKSTLLEIIYGLLDAQVGEVFWNDKKLLGPKFNIIPGEEFMKYLPQDFDLMPFITVEENVGKHLSALDPNKSDRIDELLGIVDMKPFAKIKVKNLSGGQKQRVAIAKVLAKEPEVLLLDEPFSHIDNFRKNRLRRNLFNYLKSKEITCIVATHDTTDALSFADEILVIHEGSIIAKETPEQLYHFPKSPYIASFFNEINTLPENLLNPESTSDKEILIYPEQLQLVESSGLEIEVKGSYFKGSHYLIEALYKNNLVYFNHPEVLNAGMSVQISLVKSDPS